MCSTIFEWIIFESLQQPCGASWKTRPSGWWSYQTARLGHCCGLSWRGAYEGNHSLIQKKHCTAHTSSVSYFLCLNYRSRKLSWRLRNKLRTFACKTRSKFKAFGDPHFITDMTCPSITSVGRRTQYETVGPFYGEHFFLLITTHAIITWGLIWVCLTNYKQVK